MKEAKEIELLKDVLAEVYGIYESMKDSKIYVDGKVDITVSSTAHFMVLYEALRAYLEEIE